MDKQYTWPPADNEFAKASMTLTNDSNVGKAIKMKPQDLLVNVYKTIWKITMPWVNQLWLNGHGFKFASCQSARG